MISPAEVLIRLLAALVFCGAVGVQRFLAGKAAGVRTHILVGMGAAIFTLISGYAFHTSPANSDRIAAQVVSGIGFIGGGAILKEGTSIRGLTTAAGLWAAASLGMAAGAGLYVIGALGTLIILLTLALLRRLENYLPRRVGEIWSIEITLEGPGSFHPVQQVLIAQCRTLALEGLTSDEQTSLVFAANLPHNYNIEILTDRLRAAGARRVVWHAHESGNMESGA